MNKLALLTAVAVISVPVSSFAQDKLTAAGITVGTLGNPFFVPLIKGAEDGLKEKNPATKVTVVGADYDLNKQASQIDSFIAGGSQVVLINAVDAVAVKPFVEKAKAAGAVVAAMDVSAAGSDLTVMTNNVQAGELACTDLAERLKGKGDVVIINGPPISSIMDRVKGCKQAFSKYPDIKVLSDNQDGKASREGGLAVMQSLLTRFDKIDAVFGANDPTAIGADLAARQLNRSEMIIAGVDGSPDIKKELEKSDTQIAGTAAQSPINMGKKAVEVGLAILNGEEYEKENYVEIIDMITKDNVEMYGADGWQ